MTTIIYKLTVAAVLVSLAGCTPAQQARLQADQAKAQSFIAQNADRIKLVCGDVLAVANNPLTDLAGASVPIVGQVQAAVKAGCGTAEGIATMAQSASTIDWLASAKTVMASQGVVLPPPVAPAPVGGAS